MRGFCTTPGVLGRQSAASILFLFIPGAMLISAGCSGLVNGSTSGGGGTPLTISNVAATNATPTSVKIGWQTSTPANSQVEYGTTTSYGSTTVIDPTMVTIHQLTVSNLKPGTAYHCRAHSTDAKNNSAVSGDLACSTAADTMPPTISITSPAANATLSGTVSLTATATDDVAVASVQFKVDNGNTGAAITAAPYSYALNTTTFSNGNHTLTAVATDTSGNTATSTGVLVNVNNTTPAPSITSLNPAAGVVGASVTINGANFGATRGTSTVTFNGIATTPTNWTATSIVAPVPNGATTGNVVVTVGGVASNGVSFTVQTDATPPVVTITAPACDPASGDDYRASKQFDSISDDYTHSNSDGSRQRRVFRAVPGRRSEYGCAADDSAVFAFARHNHAFQCNSLVDSGGPGPNRKPGHECGHKHYGLQHDECGDGATEAKYRESSLLCYPLGQGGPFVWLPHLG